MEGWLSRGILKYHIMTVYLFFTQIDSDLASSQASSRGSSPFLPPAMPLLQMKTVPVMESYNEAAIDVPPELLATSGLTDSEHGSPSKLVLVNALYLLICQ